MNCPRCGGRLTRYRLGEREAVGCGSCSYVGVSVDHTAEQGHPESWDDAIDRFQRRGQSVTTVTRADLPVDVPDADTTGEVTLGDWEAVENAETLVRATLDDADDRVRPVFEDPETDETGAAGGED